MSRNIILPASTEKDREPTLQNVPGQDLGRNLLAMFVAIEPTSLELRKVMYVTQNMANRRLQRNSRKLVEGCIGGIISSLFILSVKFGF